MLTKVVILALVLYGCMGADAKHSSPSGCGSTWAQEYDQVLDAYFAHARGNSPSAIVLRVYGARTEYEILLNPENSAGKLVRYVATEPIWENVYSLGKPHLTIEQYVTQAEEIPFSKDEFKISDELMQSLLARAAAIDSSICEHRAALMDKDAQWFEIIRDQRRIRAQVTDAGPKVRSQNPALLSWGHDLLQAVGQLPNRK